MRAQAVQQILHEGRSFEQVAAETGASVRTVRRWVSAHRSHNAAPGAHVPDQPPRDPPVRARLEQMEAQLRRLREENAFLARTVAFFASRYQGARIP